MSSAHDNRLNHPAAWVILTCLGAAPLGGCTPIVAHSGFQAIDSKPTDLKVGVDTKSTVRAKLGSPSVISTFDPNIWFYISQVKQRVAFRRPQIIKRDVVALTFDKDTEAVSSVESLDLGDGKQIAFSGRETPTRGRAMTVLEQLLGSVGRGTMLPNQDQGVPGTRPGDRRR
ncbi:MULTISPECIES: outer membrane protein assembly factor BamE [unclassified Phenylobacterium]|jgi:outer membrane protein assembly factor BamE (lipoprotein component of BamABCDE complex)|uniref:outer membrane protein assembly factor BamE n=1 Tax=unclassified Phenylobacterium TaxID=2640670 RepID=UPI0009EAAD6C|nr:MULTISPECIES: outer membrane protein assembly factor BamE [unclassified Phenylobacterium]